MQTPILTPAMSICSAALSQAEFFLLLLQPRLFPRSSRTNLPFPAPLDQEEGWGSSAVSLHFLVGSVVNTGESWAVPVYVTEVLCPLRSPVLCFLLLCYLELQGAKQQSYGNKQQLPQRQRWAITRTTVWEVQNKHTVGWGSFFTYLG